MSRNKRKYSTAAGDWLRDAESPIGKSKSIADGELTALLIAQQTQTAADIEKGAFEALLRLRDSLTKASGAAVVAYSIGLLTLSNMLSGLSASGMEIERNAFGHVSLLLIGVTSFWWATTFAKVCYLTTWFGWRLKSASPPDRAVLLLRFPEAFPYFAFFPGARGYPKNVWPARSEHYQVAALIFIVVAVLIFAVGGMALNIALAVQVWQSNYPTVAAAKLTVAGAIMLSLLGLSVPRFNELKIRYDHFGFAALLTSMSAERREVAHRRIAAARARMSADDRPGPP